MERQLPAPVRQRERPPTRRPSGSPLYARQAERTRRQAVQVKYDFAMRGIAKRNEAARTLAIERGPLALVGEVGNPGAVLHQPTQDAPGQLTNRTRSGQERPLRGIGEIDFAGNGRRLEAPDAKETRLGLAVDRHPR